jgi:hypothetical protein
MPRLLHICHTPLHVFRASQIALADREVSGAHQLIVCPNFPTGDDLGLALERWEETPFERSFLLSAPPPTRVNLVVHHYRRRRFLLRIIERQRPDVLYLYADGLAAVQDAVRAALKLRPDCQLRYVEDGLDTYLSRDDIPARRSSLVVRVMGRLVFGRGWIRGGRLGTRFPYSVRLAAHPHLVVDEVAREGVEWTRLPPVDASIRGALRSLGKHWAREIEDWSQPTVLLLLPYARLHSEVRYRIVSEVLALVTEMKRNGLAVAVKPHPGDDTWGEREFAPLSVTMLPRQLPIEAIVLAGDRFIRAVLGVRSAALITCRDYVPKLTTASIAYLVGSTIEDGQFSRLYSAVGVHEPNSISELLSTVGSGVFD